MTSNLNHVEQFLKLLQKKAQLDKKNLTLDENDYRTFLNFAGTICTNLMYRDKQLFINLVIDFINEPTRKRADWFSGQFIGLYNTFDKEFDILEEQLLMSSDERTLAKCNELLKSETENVSIFCDVVENLWFYCEFYNPALSEEDDSYCDDQQLKEACEQFLDKIKDL